LPSLTTAVALKGTNETVPVRAASLSPFLLPQAVVRLVGKGMVTVAVPVNDPEAMLAFTTVGAKVAEPLYGTPPMSPVTVPLHVIVNGSDAPVEDMVTQLMGLWVNDPVIFALVMVTALSPVAHAVRLPVALEGLVPPPVRVSGGENATLAVILQVTEPGAAPEK
jgi:hypothetical protein